MPTLNHTLNDEVINLADNSGGQQIISLAPLHFQTRHNCSVESTCFSSDTLRTPLPSLSDSFILLGTAGNLEGA